MIHNNDESIKGMNEITTNFVNVGLSKSRDASPISDLTVASDSSFYSTKSTSPVSSGNGIDIPQPRREEIIEAAIMNDPRKLNALSLPEASEYIIEGSSMKLEEGSSGIISKIKLKQNRSSYVIKIMKSEMKVETKNEETLALTISKTRSNASVTTTAAKRINSITSISRSSSYTTPVTSSPSQFHYSPLRAMTTAKSPMITKSVKEGGECVIRPYYTFDTLNEYLTLSKLQTKYVTPVHAILRMRMSSNETDAVDSSGDSVYSFDSTSFEEEEEGQSAPQSYEMDPINVCLLFDYYPNSDLLHLVTMIRRRNLQTSSIFKDSLFSQLVQGLKFIHSQGVVHRDIKPENVLIDNFGVLKFSDFGYAVDLARIDEYPFCFDRDDDDNLFLERGTNSFKAPEIVNASQISKFKQELKKDSEWFKSVDIWALGILYYQIVFMQKPWKLASKQDNDFKKFMDKYESKKVGKMKTGFDMKRALTSEENEGIGKDMKMMKDDIIKTVLKMLNPNFMERVTIVDVSRSEWMVSTRMLVEEAQSKSKSSESELIRVLKALSPKT